MAKRYRLKLASWVVFREPGEPSPRFLEHPEAAARLAQDLVTTADHDKEHFWAVLLNTQNRYLMHTLVSIGTQAASLVHPREVFGPALREGAAALILVHNHPSGDPTPSREDVTLTRQLAEVGKVVQVKIHDHIIIGNGTEKWVSLAERGAI